jgi:phosphatidylethanolamine/phosphatidyl-N-methylethanolamine N-methyltransferase
MSTLSGRAWNGSAPFLRSWLRDPVAVGLPFPSSPRLALRLAETVRQAAISSGGPVLELGAGTGAVTKALMETGWPPDRIVVVERDGELCRTLQRRLPGLQVLQADALKLGAVARRTGLSRASVVLCGLPMRAIPPQVAFDCYLEAFRLLPPGGAIIQYTYGFRPPVDPQATAPPLKATFVGREWLNCPPVGIWRYSLAASASVKHAAD